MTNRRTLLKSALKTSALFTIGPFLTPLAKAQKNQKNNKSISSIGPIVISTWEVGMDANAGAWKILSQNGSAIDAVEKGVMVIEDTINCCVGLGGNPDRTGKVTLDACIMDHQFNCGAVAALERIKHPIAVARKVMEKTPHVFLVGEGAQAFALEQGFKLESEELSPEAKDAFEKFKKSGIYKPQINIENTGTQQADTSYYTGGPLNHDTIAMLAMDANGNISGSCTTSGMKFKMRGRLGDSPIIGSGLFVDNEVGACAATGQGEDVIRIAGSSFVVEQMRNGLSPEEACKKAIERIVKIKGEAYKDIQVAFIAINKKGEVGAYCIHPEFNYAVRTNNINQLVTPKSYIPKKK